MDLWYALIKSKVSLNTVELLLVLGEEEKKEWQTGAPDRWNCNLTKVEAGKDTTCFWASQIGKES